MYIVYIIILYIRLALSAFLSGRMASWIASR